MPLPLLYLGLTFAAQTVLFEPGRYYRPVPRHKISNYNFCDSFTDPVPGTTTRYSLGLIARSGMLPQEGGAWTRSGNIVLIAGQRRGQVAIFDPLDGTQRCVPARAITPMPTPATSLADWPGAWDSVRPRENYGDRLTINLLYGGLHVSAGRASIATSEKPRDGEMVFNDPGDRSCSFRLFLLGGYLVVSDRVGSQCRREHNGMSGVYRRNPAINVEPMVTVHDPHKAVEFGFAASSPAVPIPLGAQPVPRVALREVLTAEDYPPRALRNSIQGVSRLTITIDPDGRPSACQASGAGDELDAAACRKARLRARFTPALNSHGKPVSAVIRWEVTWSIPEAWGGNDPIRGLPLP